MSDTTGGIYRDGVLLAPIVVSDFRLHPVVADPPPISLLTSTFEDGAGCEGSFTVKLPRDEWRAIVLPLRAAVSRYWRRRDEWRRRMRNKREVR